MARTRVQLLWSSPTLTSWVALSVRLSGTLVVLPMVLKYLPVEEVSVWFVFSAILGLQALFSFGFNPTFVRAIAYANAHNPDHQHPSRGDVSRAKGKVTGQEMMSVISTMRIIYRRIAMASILFFGVIGTISVYAPIGPTESHITSWAAWAVVALGGVIGIYGGMYASFLEGTENIPVLRRWGVLMGTANILASILALHFGLGLIGLAFANQFNTVGSVLINARLARARVEQGAWDGQARLHSSVFQEIWPAAWRSGIGIAMSLGIFQGSALVYAQLASPAQIASYLLALRLVQTTSTLANVPFYSALPTLARLFRSNEKAEILKIARERISIAIWLFSAIIIAIGFSGPKILQFINSNTEFVDSTVWWMLGLAFLIERVSAMHLQLFSISNKILWHIANGATAAIMLPLMVVLFRQFGVLGFPTAILISYALFYLPYSTLHLRTLFDLPIRRLDLGHAVVPVLTIGCILIYSLQMQ